MAYELWDTETGNVSGFFDTLEDALAAVRDAADRHGRRYAEAFAVIREDTRGRSELIAAGDDLVERAQAVAVPRRTNPARESA